MIFSKPLNVIFSTIILIKKIDINTHKDSTYIAQLKVRKCAMPNNIAEKKDNFKNVRDRLTLSPISKGVIIPKT